jgi:hypothetical protein
MRILIDAGGHALRRSAVRRSQPGANRAREDKAWAVFSRGDRRAQAVSEDVQELPGSGLRDQESLLGDTPQRAEQCWRLILAIA